MAKIYDPLKLMAPITLGGKFLYRDICEAKLVWDAKLPRNLMQNWIRLEENLAEEKLNKPCYYTKIIDSTSRRNATH